MKEKKVFYIKEQNSSHIIYWKCTSSESVRNNQMLMSVLIRIRKWDDGETEINYNCENPNYFSTNSTFVDEGEFNMCLVNCINDLVEVSNTATKTVVTKDEKIDSTRIANPFTISSNPFEFLDEETPQTIPAGDYTVPVDDYVYNLRKTGNITTYVITESDIQNNSMNKSNDFYEQISEEESEQMKKSFAKGVSLGTLKIKDTGGNE